jgi:hypothetical protein
MGMQVFGDPQALEGERPGQIRLLPPEGEIPSSQVHICAFYHGADAQPVRTVRFLPLINLSGYKPHEFQKDCEIIVGETQPDCKVRTADCPGVRGMP